MSTYRGDVIKSKYGFNLYWCRALERYVTIPE